MTEPCPFSLHPEDLIERCEPADMCSKVVISAAAAVVVRPRCELAPREEAVRPCAAGVALCAAPSPAVRGPKMLALISKLALSMSPAEGVGSVGNPPTDVNAGDSSPPNNDGVAAAAPAP